MIEFPRELRDYARGIAGGLIVGLPLLYTMEVWFKGATLQPIRIVALLAVAFGLVIAFNLIAGFRRERTVKDVVVDSVEALGIAVAVSIATLWLLGRLEGAAPSPAAGMVALEAIPVAFGVSLARSQFGSGDGDGPSKRGQSGPIQEIDKQGAGRVGSFAQLTLAAAGALVFALNVAPTEEVVLIAGSADAALLVLLVAASLLLTLALVFWSDFPAGLSVDPESPLDGPYAETVAAYAVSLGVSLLLLWAFGRTSDSGPLAIVSMMVVLGFVASLGGAIGRLLVGGGTEGRESAGSRGARAESGRRRGSR